MVGKCEWNSVGFCVLRSVQLKAFFHNKEDKSDNTEKDAFETLTAKKSKWTPPEGQFASIDYFIKKCRHDVHKLKPNCNTKLSNLSKEEWTALINLKNRNDLVIKAADKGGATVVWRTDLYQQEAIRQLSDSTFYTKVNKHLTPANQKIVKDTIQELITKQELPVTAQNLIITTPRTSCIYFKPKIHKPNNPGRRTYLELFRQSHDTHSQITTFIYQRQQPRTRNIP